MLLHRDIDMDVNTISNLEFRNGHSDVPVYGNWRLRKTLKMAAPPQDSSPTSSLGQALRWN
jgi:hypothetical protein